MTRQWGREDMTKHRCEHLGAPNYDDRDEPGGLFIGQVWTAEDEARVQARDAWVASWAGIQIPVPWEFDGKTGVDTYLVSHLGITDQWGNFYCVLPEPLTPVGNVETLAAYIAAQPDREEE